MRTTEGDHLERRSRAAAAALAVMLDEIDGAADEGRGELQARLAARVQELAGELPAIPI